MHEFFYECHFPVISIKISVRKMNIQEFWLEKVLSVILLGSITYNKRITLFYTKLNDILGVGHVCPVRLERVKALEFYKRA